MLDALKRFYRCTVTYNEETRVVQRFVEHAAEKPSSKILDVGCGYGRHLRAFAAKRYATTGVDANAEIVRANVAAGLNCVTPSDFEKSQGLYDVILMSHVIEHFQPSELVGFMDGYLDRLRPGGYLVVATPLLSGNFYDDFDHVKPYQPIGLLMVFGTESAQVQYYARNRLVLRDVWFRRSPLRLNFVRPKYLRTAGTRPVQVAEFLLALLFRASGGIIGRKDGWVGLFRKVDPAGAAAPGSRL